MSYNNIHDCQPGDRVLIKKTLIIRKRYSVYRQKNVRYAVSEGMLPYCDTWQTIKSVNSDGSYKLDNMPYTWTDNMFSKLDVHSELRYETNADDPCVIRLLFDSNVRNSPHIKYYRFVGNIPPYIYEVDVTNCEEVKKYSNINFNNIWFKNPYYKEGAKKLDLCYQERVNLRGDVRDLYQKVLFMPTVKQYRGYTDTKSYGWDPDFDDYIKKEGEYWFDNPGYKGKHDTKERQEEEPVMMEETIEEVDRKYVTKKINEVLAKDKTTNIDPPWYEDKINNFIINQHFNYCLGTAIKHIYNYKNDNLIENLHKAIEYINLEIDSTIKDRT